MMSYQGGHPALDEPVTRRLRSIDVHGGGLMRVLAPWRASSSRSFTPPECQQKKPRPHDWSRGEATLAVPIPPVTSGGLQDAVCVTVSKKIKRNLSKYLENP